MKGNNFLKLISMGKVYKIPSNFHSLSDINPEIYDILITKGEYEIKSYTSETVIESFINHWLTGQPPEFQCSNIFGFASLSYEFDRMKDLIELYIKCNPSDKYSELINKQLLAKKQIKDKKLAFEGQIKNYQKTISILFQHEQIGKLINENKEDGKAHQCLKDRIKFVEFNSLKTIKVNGLLYKINEDEKEATLFGYEKPPIDLFIPRSIEYENEEFLVTKIFENSFSRCDQIKTVTFSENSEIRSIGDKSFSNLQIESITIPSKVKIIGEESFHFLPNLKTVKFAKNSELEVLKNACFTSCSIENIHLPSKLKRIGKFCFMYCKNLQKVEISEDSELRVIENMAFLNSSIESLSIPSSIVELHEKWCESIVHLKNIKIIQKEEKNVDFYDNNFLIGKSNIENDFFDVLLFARRDIENVTIPSFIRKIAPYAFANCFCLKNVDFEENSQIQFIEMYAFANSSLENISIPSSLVRIGLYAFDSCTSLKNVNFSKSSKLFSIDEHAFSRSSIEKIKFPHVVAISMNSFVNCMKLRKVSIKSGLKIIGNSAFNESIIEKVTIPSSLVNLHNPWWYKLYRLKKVKVIECGEKNVTFYDGKFFLSKINGRSENYDFLHFARRDVENVTIPSFVKKIDQFAFENCSKLKSVDFSEDSKIESICEYAFTRSSLERISFPSHLKTIGYSAFCSCYKLKSIEFSECSQLESIQTYSFGFTSIEKVCLPSSLRKIGSSSFSDCKNLEKVSFQKNSEIKIIEKNTFYNGSLKSISIPSSIEILEDGWLSKSSSLTDIEIIECKEKNVIYFDEKFILGKSDLKSDIYDVLLIARKDTKIASIPSFIRKIADYAFECCLSIDTICFSDDSELDSFQFAFMDSSLERISIPSKCKTIGKYSFYNCRNLRKVTFSENSKLTSIGEYAFTNSALNSFVVPSHVSKIYHTAFQNCRNLQIIEFELNFDLKTISVEMFRSSSVLIMTHVKNLL